MLPNSPVDDFEWTEERPEFKKDSTENYNQDSDVGYFFEVDDPYLWKLWELDNDLPILQNK